MADEDEDWSPEGEKPDEALREHNRLVREMLDFLKGAKDAEAPKEIPPNIRKALEDLKARRESRDLEPSPASVPELERLRKEMDEGQAALPVMAHTYTAPTLTDSATRLQRIWTKVKDLFSDAPNEIKIIAFQNLLHTSDDEPEAPPAKTPSQT